MNVGQIQVGTSLEAVIQRAQPLAGPIALPSGKNCYVDELAQVAIANNDQSSLELSKTCSCSFLW